jgi:hypothetical protein
MENLTLNTTPDDFQCRNVLSIVLGTTNKNRKVSSIEENLLRKILSALLTIALIGNSQLTLEKS